MLLRQSLILGAFFGLLLAVSGGASAQSFHDRTVTIHVHGFTPFGPLFSQPYGEDIVDLNDIKYGNAGFDTVALAGLLGRPTILDPGGSTAPNLVTAVSFYGDQPPAYYTPQDVADIATMEASWGGGVPKYAWILAKFSREVLNRTGAEQVNIVSVSLAGEVTRWMLENDLEGLASSGRIARWVTYEGVLSGNWAASRGIVEILTFLGLLQEEVDHMDYSWVDANIHNPGSQLDNPIFANIQIAHGIPVRDNLLFATLTNAIYLLNGSYLPNDGINLVADAAFQDVTSRSRFLGRSPTISHFDGNHFSVENDLGARAALATQLSGSRRVTITLEQAKVSNLHEIASPFQNSDSEILFESSITSPWVETAWGITDPVNDLARSSGVPPIWIYTVVDTYQTLDHVVFDDLVRDEETILRLDLSACEVDRATKYGMLELATNPITGVTDMGNATIDLDLSQQGQFSLQGPEWDVTLRVDVAFYPIGRSLYLPDENDTGAGLVSALGESQDMDLAAGPSLAGQPFLLLGGASGSSPGLPLPGGPVLPLNPDAYTNTVLSTLFTPLHQGFLGVLSVDGRSRATFNAAAVPLPPVAIGWTLTYAAAVFDPVAANVLSVTNPVTVTVVP